jgi:hypothetical protein
MRTDRERARPRVGIILRKEFVIFGWTYMWYCLILLFSGSMDRSHLGDHQKIYIYQNFQKLT